VQALDELYLVRRLHRAYVHWVQCGVFPRWTLRPHGGSGDNTLILWDVETGDPVRTFTGHTQSVMSVAFSPMDASPSVGRGITP
jgi:WD40 repeat protein